MKIESRIGKCSYTPSRIYTFVSDFRNFNKFIPDDKISDWEAEADRCTFRMDLLGKVALSIIEKESGKMVKISSDPSVSQYNFNLWIQLKEIESEDTAIKVTMEPKINAVMLSMVKSHLKSFVDTLVGEIENFSFPDQ